MRKLLLYPLSLLYGLAVSVRNWMYDLKILKSQEFEIPVISIGNITVGGTGKTPHVEYLIRLLRSQFRVAVLSRGYKRHTQGFLAVESTSAVTDSGDEPLQIKRKFPSVTMAVCENRVTGINTLLSSGIHPDVFLLDDGYQHRRVTPGINILLVDYNHPLKEDQLLPAGRLRESMHEIRRANIIIITKCPREITPIARRINEKEVKLFPYQELYFTTMVYGQLAPVFPETPPMDLFTDTRRMGILAVAGIASPGHFIDHLKELTGDLDAALYPDHHYYTENEIHQIIQKYYRLQSSRKIIVTTEKDVPRLTANDWFPPEIKSSFYYLPVQVKFLDKEGKLFDKKIIDYVAENKINRELHQRKGKAKQY